MKTLLLMRHGKSSWKHPELSDHERPLAKRGLTDAHVMADLIKDRELTPEVILCSSSVRTLHTAQIVAENCGRKSEIRSLDSLYLAESDAYISALISMPGDVERVMIIGHNPGLESLLQILSKRIESLSTAVIAYITLPIKSWSDLSSDIDGELVELWRPKEIRVIEKDQKKEKKTKKDKK